MSSTIVGLGVFTVGLIGATLWIALRPTKCPSCRRGLREHALHDGGLGLTCLRCNVTYRRTDDHELITEAAYEHGATEPPAEARVR